MVLSLIVQPRVKCTRLLHLWNFGFRSLRFLVAPVSLQLFLAQCEVLSLLVLNGYFSRLLERNIRIVKGDMVAC